MRTKVISCVICALIVVAVFTVEESKDVCAQPSIQWEKIFGGPSEDYAHSIEQTSDGGYIIGGSSSEDMWLIKTDFLGNEQWNRTFHRNVLDCGHTVQQTSDGGYIIVGHTGTHSGNTQDVWLVKTDSYGNKQWDKTYDNDGRGDEGYDIQQSSDGGYIIVGKANQHRSAPYHSESDLWVIKTDSLGNKQWDKIFGKGGYYEDQGRSIQLTSDGGFIIIGYTESYGPRGFNIWLIKIDSSGNEQWKKTFGGWDKEFGYSVQQTSDSGFIITGSTYSYGSGGGDLWLIKTDSSGNEQWNKTFGGSLKDTGISIRITSDSGYIISGFTQSYGAGWGDAWLIKTDSSGNEQWNKTFGGSDWDDSPSVRQTLDNNYIIVVCTRSYGPGEYDVWLIKLGPETGPEPTIDIDPDTLNIKSKGRWITCYITLNSPYNVNNIDISTILLEDTIPAEWGDIQGDTLMVKFDRSEVEDMLSPGTYNLKVTGELTDGTEFEGYSDEIRVIDP